MMWIEKEIPSTNTKSIMADTFPWQHGVFKLCSGDYAVLVLNCCRKYLNMTFEIRLNFGQVHKLIPTLNRTEKYVLDYRNLRQYIDFRTELKLKTRSKKTSSN